MKNFLRLWLVNGISLWVVDALMSGIGFSDSGSLIATALALTVLNMTIKPILKVLSLPITILSFGLFSWIINGVVLSIAFHMSSGSYLSSFGTALIASLILALLNSALGSLFARN